QADSRVAEERVALHADDDVGRAVRIRNTEPQRGRRRATAEVLDLVHRVSERSAQIDTDVVGFEHPCVEGDLVPPVVQPSQVCLLRAWEAAGRREGDAHQGIFDLLMVVGELGGYAV